jgi:hypothetical protein
MRPCEEFCQSCGHIRSMAWELARELLASYSASGRIAHIAARVDAQPSAAA